MGMETKIDEIVPSADDVDDNDDSNKYRVCLRSVHRYI